MDEGEQGGRAWNCLDAWDPVQECMAQLAATRGCCGQGVDRTECCLLRERRKTKPGLFQLVNILVISEDLGACPLPPFSKYVGPFLQHGPARAVPSEGLLWLIRDLCWQVQAAVADMGWAGLQASSVSHGLGRKSFSKGAEQSWTVNDKPRVINMEEGKLD